MNMLLHGIGEMTGETAVSPADALISPPSETFDYVLANPPFGKKSSMSFTNAEGEQETDDLTYNRQDFWATTSNKQLNFVQHIRTMLKTNRARGRRRPRQRAVRGRCWRDDSSEAASDHGPAHDSAATHRHLLRAGRQGERHFLRQPSGQPRSAEFEGLVLTTTAPTCITRSSRSR